MENDEDGKEQPPPPEVVMCPNCEEHSLTKTKMPQSRSKQGYVYCWICTQCGYSQAE